MAGLSSIYACMHEMHMHVFNAHVCNVRMYTQVSVTQTFPSGENSLGQAFKQVAQIIKAREEP